MGTVLTAGVVQRPRRAVWWGGGCCGQAVEELLDIHADVALHDADVQNARGLHPSVRSTIVVLPVRCEPAHGPFPDACNPMRTICTEYHAYRVYCCLAAATN